MVLAIKPSDCETKRQSTNKRKQHCLHLIYTFTMNCEKFTAKCFNEQYQNTLGITLKWIKRSASCKLTF